MKAFLTILACAFASTLFSQSNIQQSLSVNGTGNAADASAQLDVSANNKGMLVPRMTSLERAAIASPVNGLFVYDTNTNSFWHFNGTAWVNLTTARTLQDADGNTKVQVEESPNENTIRFDVNGNEAMVIDPSGRLGIGTGAPAQKLDILGGNPDEGAIMQMSNSDRTKFFRLFSGRENDANPFLNWQVGTDFRFATSNNDFSGFAERMRLTANGSLGIGTATPDALLHIEDGALLAKGTTGGMPDLGAGTRLMWIPEKKAFRAGQVTGAQWDNANIGEYSFVGGGSDNTASGSRSFVGGGANNTTSDSYSFAGGGYSNHASGIYSFAGGGSSNIASGSRSFVGGGTSNTASGEKSFVGGGTSNTASYFDSFVGGGYGNTASGGESFVGGGVDNTASGHYSFVGGGAGLLAKSFSEAVFGILNTDYTPASIGNINATDRLFVIGNGTSTGARSNAMTVLKSGNVGIGADIPVARLHIEGGALLAQGITGTTPVSGAGTRLMWVPAKRAFRAGSVSSTEWDDANIGSGSFVGGGTGATASGDLSFTGGGSVPTASGVESFVGGGNGGLASGEDSFVGGGTDNTASGRGAFVGGGNDNVAAERYSFIGGGDANHAMERQSFIGGGIENMSSGRNTFIGGGSGLLAKSFAEAVFGTYNTDYTPDNAIVIDPDDRLFVIGNGTSTGARSNAVTVLKNGKVGVGTDSPKNKLDVEGGIAIGVAYSGTSTAPTNGAIIEGNVGIGTTNPLGRLSLTNKNVRTVDLLFRSDDTNTGSGGTDYSATRIQAGWEMGETAYNDAFLKFDCPTAENTYSTAMTIKGGNVGIDVNVPTSKLHVEGVVRVDGTSSANVLLTSLSGFPNNGAAVVFDVASNEQAGIVVDAAGLGVVFGDVKAFVMQHPEQPDKNIWYASLEGPEAAAYERGTAVLQNGEAFVPFSDHYRLVANPETMTVLLTPAEWDTYGLAVVEKTATGFRVKELKGGAGNFAFDWEVKCVRKGFEDYRVVRDKRELEFGKTETGN